MPTTTYIGETDFTQQQGVDQFIEGQGWSSTVPYRGSASQLNGFLAELLLLAGQFGGITALRITPDGPYVNVDVTYAQSPYNPAVNQDPISTVWTLHSSMNEVSALGIGKIQNGFIPILKGVRLKGLNEMKTDELAALKSEIELQAADTTRERFADNTMGAFLLALKLREETAFMVPSYVLKKTETVFVKTQLVASHTNVGKIHNYSDLTSAELSLPAAILVDPIRMSSAEIQGRKINWMKMPPEVDRITGGRYQIIQEYWSFNAFNPYIYDTVSSFNENTYNQVLYDFNK